MPMTKSRHKTIVDFSLSLVTVLLVGLMQTPAMAADTEAPILVDWTIKSANGNIAETDARLTVAFIISDESSIDQPNLLLKSLTTTQLTAFAEVKEIAKSGRLTSYEATAIVKKGQSPRKWEWVLYPLRDSLGNSSNRFGPDEKWIKTVVLWDKSYHPDITFCENGVDAYNKAVLRFREFETKNPNSEIVSVWKFKQGIPASLILIDSARCESNLQETMNKYSAVEASNIISGIAGLSDQIIVANEKIRAEAEAKTKAEAEAKAKAEAEAKAAAELKAKQEAEAKAKAEAAQKKSTITCTKGKKVKKVTAVNPKCPKGYKKK